MKITQSYLTNHVNPFFGDLPLRQITQSDIIKFYEQKKREGYSEATIRRVFIFLSTLFKKALKKGLVEQNPMEGMKIMNKVSKRTILPLSKKEIIRLLEVANLEGEGMVYEFVLHTGARLGEVLALKWSDIDLDKETLTINISKSQARKLKLPPHLVSKLKEHKVKQQLVKERVGKGYKDKLDLVFPKDNGDFQNTSTVRLKLHRLTEKAGLRKMTFHDLRRTHVYILFLAGVSPYIIKERLGFKYLETALKHYFSN